MILGLSQYTDIDNTCDIKTVIIDIVNSAHNDIIINNSTLVKSFALRVTAVSKISSPSYMYIDYDSLAGKTQEYNNIKMYIDIIYF